MINIGKKGEISLPREIPVVSLENDVVFPYLIMPLLIRKQSLIKLIDDALSKNKIIGCFLAKKSDKDKLGFYKIGTSAIILKMMRYDSSVHLLIQGIQRVEVEKVIQKEPYFKARVFPIKESTDVDDEVDAMKNVALDLFKDLINMQGQIPNEVFETLKHLPELSRICDIIAANSNIKTKEKQILLETIPLRERYAKLNRFLSSALKRMRVEIDIKQQVDTDMTDRQREYYLRQQLAAIKKELGESDEVDQEILKWEKAIAKAKLPKHAEKTAREELGRLKMMSPASSEYAVIRNYLEWIVKLPWKKKTKDNLNISRIEKILDDDHYGLKDAKERVVEYIAVKKLKSDMKGPILCFVGPPGTGKTSLGKSIARALGRKFIRISLGGIRDEAEIRGHRRTYIGAMPGRIINEIKRVESRNPVFMLDEVDKIGQDFRGDPASALLEVLDPEQNDSFTDHYLDLAFDLSDVMFITTANTTATIPPPLLDRMEQVEFSSYIEEEKIEIAQIYLVPKQMRENGLSGKYVRLKKSALQEICRYYTSEAGVRNLEREIAKVMRKVARKVASGEKKLNVITKNNIREYLGSQQYIDEIANRQDEIGIATGLAWTPVGGKVLFVETSKMKGKGELIITGLLGDVMKESVKIAQSYLHSNARKYGVDEELFDKYNFHIHIPSGAIPKDGPSAGITLTSSLASTLSGKFVHHDIAMTGEITLQGKILSVGGIKEKVLAAKRAGILSVVLPAENEKDVSEIDKEIIEGLKFTYVNRIDQVLDLVLFEKNDKIKDKQLPK